MRFRILVPVAALLMGAAAARADGMSVIAEAGAAARGTHIYTVGVAWPLAWRRVAAGGEWSLSAELLLSHFNARQPAGERKSFVQLAAVPVFRYRLAEGRSPLFAEAGIGVSYFDREYTTSDKIFSTRFNFHDTVGVGANFGAQRENEVGLRLTHISNGGIKHPNPGETFVQLRYARSF